MARPGGPDLTAFNDACVVRNGIGQVRVTSTVDGVLFTRLAGDGCIVSTPLGSTAYALAAGGPLMAPGTDAYLLMPLASHGGWRQPLVIPAAAELALEISVGIGGARLEIDGQVLDTDPDTLRITLRQDVATLVSFPGRSRSSLRCAGAASSPTAPGSSPTRARRGWPESDPRLEQRRPRAPRVDGPDVGHDAAHRSRRLPRTWKTLWRLTVVGPFRLCADLPPRISCKAPSDPVPAEVLGDLQSMAIKIPHNRRGSPDA